MGEAPKRIWVMGATDDDGNDFLGTCWRTPDPRALEYLRADLAKAAFLDGVKAGLEAAAKAARGDGESEFFSPVQAIRALDPAAIARAAQKEGGE